MAEVFDAKEIDRGREPDSKLHYKLNTLHYQCPSTHCRRGAPLEYVTRTLRSFGREIEVERISNGDVTEHNFVLTTRLDEYTTLSLWRCAVCGAIDYREEGG